MKVVRLTAAQLSTLECNGVFEADDMDDDHAVIRKAIEGDRLEVSETTIQAVLDLANGLDSIGHYETTLPSEVRAAYRRDSQNIYRLLDKMQNLKVAA